MNASKQESVKLNPYLFFWYFSKLSGSKNLLNALMSEIIYRATEIRNKFFTENYCDFESHSSCTLPNKKILNTLYKPFKC